MRYRRLTEVLVLVAAVLAGGGRPVWPQPAPADAGPRLAEAQELIEGAVRAYGERARLWPRVWPALGADPAVAALAGVGVALSGDTLYMAAETLRSPHRDAVVAAAVAYRMLDRRTEARSLDEYDREAKQWARDAQAKAVEILVRAKGLPEATAVRALSQWIVAQHASAPDRHTVVALCEESESLAERFPRHRGEVAGLPCPGAPSATRAVTSSEAAPALLILLTPLQAPPPAAPTAPVAPRAATPPPAAGPAPPEVPPAYCTPGHRLRYVYRCP